MVNIVIYLKKEIDAEELVQLLFDEKLIAFASIDENNISFRMNNNSLKKEIYNVITAKTKSLLLANIISVVENKIKSEFFINSIPIVGSNNYFDNLIKDNTLKI